MLNNSFLGNEVIEEENASAAISGDHSPALQGQGMESGYASLPSQGIKRELWDPMVENSHGHTTTYSPVQNVPSPPSSTMVHNHPLSFDLLQADPLLFSPTDLSTTSTPTSLVDESVDCSNNPNIWLTDFSSSPSDGGYEVEVVTDGGPFGQHNDLFPFGFESEFLSS